MSRHPPVENFQSQLESDLEATSSFSTSTDSFADGFEDEISFADSDFSICTSFETRPMPRPQTNEFYPGMPAQTIYDTPTLRAGTLTRPQHFNTGTLNTVTNTLPRSQQVYSGTMRSNAPSTWVPPEEVPGDRGTGNCCPRPTLRGMVTAIGVLGVVIGVGGLFTYGVLQIPQYREYLGKQTYGGN